MQTTIAPAALTPIPAWIPARHRPALSGRRVQIAGLPVAVRRRLRTAVKIRVSEWAEKYRIVTDGHEGAWRHEYAPHTVKVMDTFGLPHVREIWFCAVEQSGKTNTMLNCLGWCIDCDPGNIFYLMPTEQAAGKIVGKKIRPALTASPRLRRYLSARADDTTLTMISLNHGVDIFPAHAGSATSMATWSAKHCFGDEVDKYPAMTGQEADPITLIKKRNRIYKGRYKRFFASTPASRFIQKGMNNCEQVWEYQVQCPDCAALLRMEAEQLVLPKEAAHDTLTAPEVGYACQACGVVWDDQARELAIRRGRWHCRKGEDVARPATVGFHHRAWECLDISLLEIASAWLKAKTGDLNDKTAWANGYECIDYEADFQDRQEDQILRLVDPAMPRHVAPRDPCQLVLLVDTQQRGFFYQVWAYGWGRDLETWRLDHGFVEQFAHLVDLARQSWTDADGRDYRCSAGFIDSGGGTNPHQPKHSRTTEVYEFCRLHPFFRPIKGRRDMAQAWNTTRLDFYPNRDGKRVPIPGGLTLYLINVTMFKNELATKLLIEPGGPGAIHLHADMDEDYAKQMCAEYRDDQGWWQCPRGKANHHWDISVYGLAAAEILRIRDKRPAAAVGPQRKIHSKGIQQ